MFRKTLILIAFFLACHWVVAAERLVGGPYAVHVTSKSATVMWIVETSEVRLGLSPNQPTQTVPSLHCEKVTYAGLEPGKTYYYDVAGEDAGKGSFKTAPAGRAAFKFVVFGDTRTRNDVHRRVVDAITKSNPDFVIHTGDLVSDGRNTAQWPVFFSIEKELLRKAAFFPSLGNHERNDPQYYEFFDVQTPYYSFDWGAVHFVVLNSDIGNVALSAEGRKNYWEEQKRWMEDDLGKSRPADFRFVVFHHPPFTAVKKRQGEGGLVRDLVPLFTKYNVAAVFNGHDHNYQHHFKDGVHYIVTGGGGAPLYPVDSPIPGLTQKMDSTEHFVEIDVSGKTARVEAHALDGRILDTIELK